MRHAPTAASTDRTNDLTWVVNTTLMSTSSGHIRVWVCVCVYVLCMYKEEKKPRTVHKL